MRYRLCNKVISRRVIQCTSSFTFYSRYFYHNNITNKYNINLIILSNHFCDADRDGEDKPIKIPSNIYSLHSRDGLLEHLWEGGTSLCERKPVFADSADTSLSQLSVWFWLVASLWIICTVSIHVWLCVPVQRPSRCDGFREVVDQRSPAASVDRHGQRMRMVGLQDTK